MATKNRAIAVYLPDDLLEKVTEFCNANGLTRTYRDNIQDPERAGKTEPSLGTGIVKRNGDIFRNFQITLVRSKIAGSQPGLSEPRGYDKRFKG